MDGSLYRESRVNNTLFHVQMKENDTNILIDSDSITIQYSITTPH